MPFSQSEFSFVATSNLSTLAFLATNVPFWDDSSALIDHVQMSQISAPVPEPETFTLLLVGLGYLGVAGCRKKQKTIA